MWGVSVEWGLGDMRWRGAFLCGVLLGVGESGCRKWVAVDVACVEMAKLRMGCACAVTFHGRHLTVRGQRPSEIVCAPQPGPAQKQVQEGNVAECLHRNRFEGIVFNNAENRSNITKYSTSTVKSTNNTKTSQT